MATYLKKRIDQTVTDAIDAKVRSTVEGIMTDIKKRGDAAVRDLSTQFDKWSPPSFKLSPSDIEAIMAKVKPETIADIKFAQAQIRNFAQHQRAALKDIEVETLPGVKLGHKNIPVEEVWSDLFDFTEGPSSIWIIWAIGLLLALLTFILNSKLKLMENHTHGA